MICNEASGCIMLFNHHGLSKTEPRSEAMLPVMLNVAYRDLGCGFPKFVWGLKQRFRGVKRVRISCAGELAG